jgi:hypothetical protein
MFTLTLPEWKARFRELLQQIKTLIGKGAGE